ncbi:type II secretion system F family protein [Ornithinimicrobium avium]|uniref:type II secretion system F family protein n=1 Tax=Ornithinimicrobium avium TaxID=2283195 RepID=UPI0013B3D535|nr:type II secretion system F family protein [Ornithinimicrobium avium]
MQLLDGLAAALEAGLSTEHALRVVLEPVGPAGSLGPWSELSRAAREGQPLAPSWSRLARRTGSPTAASVARAWSVAASTGAPLAAAVRSSAHAARERHRLERAVEVATAGARATATVLGLLPLAGVGLAALLGIGPVALYGDALALASAGLGLLLLAGGHATVRRMVRGVLVGVT